MDLQSVRIIRIVNLYNLKYFQKIQKNIFNVIFNKFSYNFL